MIGDAVDRQCPAPWFTLPPSHYDSEELFAHEIDRVWRASWVNVGHISMVPDPGGYRSVDVAGEPLVVTRDKYGELHVLSRVCAHRWMEVCTGSGSTSTLQCPYHHWTYSLTGELRAAPLMEGAPGFAKGQRGLREFRSATWQGFIYVNLDEQAAPPAKAWSGLSDHLAPYRLEEWTLVSTIDWGRCPWDWKVLMDNGECYHHLGAHRNTLERLYPARHVVDLDDNGAFTCLRAQRRGRNQRPPRAPRLVSAALDIALAGAPVLGRFASVAARATLPRSGGGRLADAFGAMDDAPMPGLPPELADALLLAYPFPNYAIAVIPTAAIWYEVQPVAAGVIELKTHLLLPPHLATGARLRGRIARNDAMVRVIHEEDAAVCAAVQRGASAASARRGPLSPYERHNRTFASWYAAAMGEAVASAGGRMAAPSQQGGRTGR